MAFAYLNTTNVFKSYKDSKAYTDSLTKRFFEYERIARNLPHPSIDAAYPKTTDGTTASIIRKTPHRIIQQLPTGTVKSDKNDWLTIVAGFIFTHKIIPKANEQYNLIQKCWNMVERALTYGHCPIYTPFLDHNGYFCSDMTLPYWGDVFLQPGKVSDSDSSYIFLRSWWREEDIDSLIDKERKLSKKKSYQSTWDLGALERVKEQLTNKDTQAMTPTERETQSSAQKGGVEFVTGFQRGVGAKFYTFHNQSKEILRTKINKDARGHIPINFMYADTDGSNPLGRGIVELVLGMQNLMDAEVQMYQYNRALMLNPPMVKRGSWNKTRAADAYRPNGLIDLGTDPNNKFEPLIIDSTAIASFPNNYGLMKSQMLNLLSSPDTSVSADSGNPGFSKTHAGVQQIQQNVSVDDNYMRKLFEAAYQAWGETAINIYFGERSGIEELQLDKETAVKLRDLPNFDLTLLSQDNKIRINYDDKTEALEFIVDPATSSMKDDQAQTEAASGLLDLTMKYTMLNSNWGGPIDVDELARRIVVSSNINDPEQVAPEPTEEQKQAKLQAKNKPSGFSPMFDKPKLDIRYPDLPPAAQVQLLGLAGIQVTEQDILQGPVADPNIRGVVNPINDPNILVPGGGPADQSTPGMPGQPGMANPLQGDGINLTPQEIQRLSQDPRFAQQQAPQNDKTLITPDHILKADQQAHQQVMDKAKFLADQQNQQMQQMQPTQQPNMSQNPQTSNQPSQNSAPSDIPSPSAQLSPEDQQLVTALQQMGIDDQKIGQALAMLHAGHPVQEILQMIGVQ